MRKCLVFCLIVLVSGCKDGDEERGFLLKSIDIAGAQALFSTVYGSYHPGDKRYLMQDLYRIEADKSFRKVEMSFHGDADDTKLYHVFDVDDRYFLLSFYKLKQTYFIEKANGTAHASTYFMPADSDPGFAFDGAENFYVKTEDRVILKIAHPLSTAATTTETIILSNAMTQSDAHIFLVDNEGNMVYRNGSFNVYLRSNNGTETRLFDTFSGFWRGLDGVIKIIDKTGKIYRVEGNGIVEDGNAPAALQNDFAQYILNFAAQNKTLGVGGPKGGKFNFYELYPHPSVQTTIPHPYIEVNRFNHEADREGQYYFMLHGNNGQGRYYLQKIDVNTFEVTERVINTKYSIYGIHAVNEDLVLFGLCVPEENGGCRPQYAYLDDAAAVEFLMEDKQWFYTFIHL